MVRTIVRLHTVILVAAGIALLMAPGTVLTAFGIADPTFPALALIRVLAGLIIVLAAAVTPVPDLAPPTRRSALALLAGAYGLLSVLCLMQQVAIWSSLAGTLLSAEVILHTVAFGWLAAAERRSVASAADR